jgi:hypothetical protein
MTAPAEVWTLASIRAPAALSPLHTSVTLLDRPVGQGQGQGQGQGKGSAEVVALGVSVGSVRRGSEREDGQ